MGPVGPTVYSINNFCNIAITIYIYNHHFVNYKTKRVPLVHAVREVVKVLPVLLDFAELMVWPDLPGHL